MIICAAGPCGESVLVINNTVPSLIHTSPSYPLDYPENIDCTWFVTASEGFAVTFNFNAFNTEEPHDVLTIGKGHRESDPASVIARLYGGLKTSKLRVSTSEHRAWVKFHSDDSVTFTGFSVDITQETARSKCLLFP